MLKNYEPCGLRATRRTDCGNRPRARLTIRARRCKGSALWKTFCPGTAMWKWRRVLVAAAVALGVAGSQAPQYRAMQTDSYPRRPYNTSPLTLRRRRRSPPVEQARRHAVLAEDALTILPPTRRPHHSDHRTMAALAYSVDLDQAASRWCSRSVHHAGGNQQHEPSRLLSGHSDAG